jgi:folate-binding Fe-S cluster repair protein YgfZ
MPATTLADRAVLRLSGEDVPGFLQGLVTNDTGLLAPGRPLWAGLLSAQGKALFDFILWPDGEDVLIDCEISQADALRKRLLIYRLRRPITIERDDSLAVHWSKEEGTTPDPRLPELGFRWLGPPGEPVEGWLRHRLSLGVQRERPSLGRTRRCGSSAMRPSLAGSASPRAAMSGRRIRRG